MKRFLLALLAIPSSALCQDVTPDYQPDYLPDYEPRIFEETRGGAFPVPYPYPIIPRGSVIITRERTVPDYWSRLGGEKNATMTITEAYTVPKRELWDPYLGW